jgi:hypothetical protein
LLLLLLPGVEGVLFPLLLLPSLLLLLPPLLPLPLLGGESMGVTSTESTT